MEALSPAALGSQGSTSRMCVPLTSGGFPLSSSHLLPRRPGPQAPVSLSFPTTADTTVPCPHNTRVSTQALGFSPTSPRHSCLSPAAFLSPVVLQGTGPQVLDDDLLGHTGHMSTGLTTLSPQAGVTTSLC